jgi:UDP-N-acetylmuramate dehydrogenase
MVNHYKSYSLKNHNTFGMEVIADDFYEYSTIEDLELILNQEDLKNKRILNIGSGSNLLFLSDFKGMVLHSKILGINIEEVINETVIVSAGAGVIWDDFVEWSVEHSFGGAENLSLIPGTVGASAVQNIGAYGVELKDIFYKVEGKYIENGDNFTFFLSDCNFDYRYSIFKGPLKDKFVITRLFLKLTKKPVFNLEYGTIKGELEKQKCSLSLQNIRNTIISTRKQKLPDPQIIGNAGSFFKNPVVLYPKFFELIKKYPEMPFYEVYKDNCCKISAGWLIEQTGWKGKQLGRAGVHENQALVLVNLGGATGNDIMALASNIENDVMQKFGIMLEKEVNVIV